MMQTTWVALILGCWSSLYLLDAFLKSQPWSARRYTTWLDKTGFSVSVCQFRWYSTAMNRTFVRLAQWRPQFLRTWFTCGVFFGLVAMLLSVFLLSLMVFNTLTRNTVESQVLTPVMPGVNLPTSQISYYLLTLLVCGILHEIGHAIAAVREQVRVNGFGLFLLLIYPGAYVDLSSDHLQVISPLRQLRIYCAGVWHNFIIVLIGIAVLFTYPWFIMPFYTTGNGVVITQVSENTAVSGPRGLAVRDPVTSIGGCKVTCIKDWNQCLAASIREPSLGNCLPVSMITELDTSNKHRIDSNSPYIDCCNETSSTHLCFMYHTKKNPDNIYACLPARATTDRPVCKFQSDCYSPNMEMSCVYPSVDNQTKLLRVIHGHKPPLLFLGHPLDLHYSVILSNYIPSSLFIPVNLPYALETFCKYLISLSGALVILNVVPCYALDGQFICQGFIELMLRSTIPDKEVRGAIYSLTVLFGTVLLALNVIMAMWVLFVG
ncbi:membrane-bound transcription factor site-2 protease-like [Ruditapes philippinarum]|uniref:membrane-bound transcription factor site-2 protease-like n=1 Tax=Ruditapes philippinarum TaxID=129788 RepID=UPI00295BD525|nr:membrane-bound transcription factor site-2 protease-like [Ruditapes philippinarum]